MKRGFLLVLLAIALLLGVRHIDTRGWIPGDKVRRPYLQQVSGDRAIVAWRTSSLHFGTATLRWKIRDDENPSAQWNQVEGGSIPSQFGADYHDHRVLVTDLPPSTEIDYQALNGSELMGSGRFRSAPEAGFDGPVRIWALGDSGTGGPVQYQVRDSMRKFLADTPLDMLLHVGDMAYSRGRDGEFSARFFRPYRKELASITCWPAPGNHEMKSADSQLQSGPYFEAYILPRQGECGGVASGTEAYYSFDYGPIHLISLDSSGDAIDPQGAMVRWLEEDLAATDRQWIIAFFHHPPYSRGSHRSDRYSDSEGRLVKMREVVVPILEAGGVDLVLTGHSHIYERSALIQGVHGYGEAPDHVVAATDQLRQDGKIIQWEGEVYQTTATGGTVYAVIGHGGGHVKKVGDHPVMVVSEAIYGSALITVEGDRLTMENLRSDGVITDEIIIDHSPVLPGK